jgi:hypothetical protein
MIQMLKVSPAEQPPRLTGPFVVDLQKIHRYAYEAFEPVINGQPARIHLGEALGRDDIGHLEVPEGAAERAREDTLFISGTMEVTGQAVTIALLRRNHVRRAAAWLLQRRESRSPFRIKDPGAIEPIPTLHLPIYD